MLTLFGLALLKFGLAAPLQLVVGRIHARSKASRVSALGALAITFFGYFVGVILTVFTAVSLLDALYQNGTMPGPLIFLSLLLSSAIGSAAGSIGGYVWIWYRTTRDLDYDDQICLKAPQIDKSRGWDDIFSI